MNIDVTKRYRDRDYYQTRLNPAYSYSSGGVTNNNTTVTSSKLLSKSITVEYPTDSENIVVCIAQVDLKILAIKTVIVSAESAPSLSIQPYYTDDLDVGTKNYFTTSAIVVTSISTVVTVTPLATIIPVNNFIVFQTSAISGVDEIDAVHMTFDFTVN
jgi:hypothetical protein